MQFLPERPTMDATLSDLKTCRRQWMAIAHDNDLFQQLADIARYLGLNKTETLRYPWGSNGTKIFVMLRMSSRVNVTINLYADKPGEYDPVFDEDGKVVREYKTRSTVEVLSDDNVTCRYHFHDPESDENFIVPGVWLDVITDLFEDVKATKSSEKDAIDQIEREKLQDLLLVGKEV